MTKRSEPYFFYMALILIVLVVSGFGLTALSRPEGPLAMPLILHIHGAVFLSWFLLLATQAGLIGAGNVRLHMNLGRLSIVLALAIVIMGYLVTRHAYGRPDWSIAGYDRDLSAIFPVTDIVNFIIVYGLALAHRKTAAAHKRLMLLAGILIIDAAVARLILALGLPGPAILGLEFSLVASLLIYDFFTLKRPHWASLLGMALFIAATAAKFSVANISWWPDMTKAMFG